MSTTKRITITGGGIGALTLALACRNAELAHFRLRLTRDEPTPSVVVLPPNATRVLRALGLADPVEPIAAAPNAHHEVSARLGFGLATYPLGAFIERRHRAPFWLVDRADLLRVLAAHVEERGIELVDERTSTSTPYDIWCDGARAHSRDRARPQEPTKTWCWWLEHDNETVQPEFCTWTGTGGQVTLFPACGARRYVQAIASCDAAHADVSDVSIANLFDAWHSAARRVLQHTTTASAVPVGLGEVDEHWHDADGIRLGASAYQLPPDHPIADAFAIEDAWVLARMLDNYDANNSTAAREYQKYRQPRARRALRKCLEARATHLDAPPARALRHRIQVALTSRFLPELFLQQTDWLYGYDCVRGFR